MNYPYHLMLIRLPLLIFLFSIAAFTGSLLIDRVGTPVFLQDDPLQLANELMNEGKMEEVIHLARFSHLYLPQDPQFSALQIEQEAAETLESNRYMLERFLTGALTGEANNTPELIGTMTLDMLVIGDIRDLLVQGYKEFDSGQGDEVIMGLSAAGLLLTLAPEFSWAPALFKTFWRGRRFSEPFQKLMRETLASARKTGDYRKLRKMISQFGDVVDSLGAGPAMAVIKRVENADDLALLSSKARMAPAETYTLASLNGVKSLENISTAAGKQGKYLQRVKLAVHQQKLFGKALGLVPMVWLLGFFSLSVLLIFFVIVRGRKQR